MLNGTALALEYRNINKMVLIYSPKLLKRWRCTKLALTEMFTGSSNYLLSPQLAQDFKTARTLGMPLLLGGEPGTGKTEFAIQYAAHRHLPIYVFPVTSKSTIEQLIST